MRLHHFLPGMHCQLLLGSGRRQLPVGLPHEGSLAEVCHLQMVRPPRIVRTRAGQLILPGGACCCRLLPPSVAGMLLQALLPCEVLLDLALLLHHMLLLLMDAAHQAEVLSSHLRGVLLL